MIQRIDQAAPAPASAEVAITMPADVPADTGQALALLPDHIAIDIDTHPGQHALFERLRDTATGLSDDNAADLIALLGEYGVMRPHDLDELIGVARSRDQLRALAAGVAVFLTSFAVGGAVNVALTGALGQSATAAPLAGSLTSAFLNPTMAATAQAGQLGPRYNLPALPGPGPASYSGQGGAAPVTDVPMRNFAMTYMLSDAINQQAGLSGWTNYAARTVAGMFATAWGVRDVQAAAAGFAAARGDWQRQRWLDAGNLQQTRQRLNSLTQSTGGALLGYGHDVAASAQHVPRAMLTTAASPRYPATAMALAPGTAFSMLSRTLNQYQTVLKALADFTLITPGWENRRLLEHHVSRLRPNYTHANAQRFATERLEQLQRLVGHATQKLSMAANKRDLGRGSAPPASLFSIAAPYRSATAAKAASAAQVAPTAQPLNATPTSVPVQVHRPQLPV